MKTFFLEIIKKIISTFLFALIMFLISYCVVTGEFPPKIAHLKRGITSLQTQIQAVRKLQEAKIAAALKTVEAANGETESPVTHIDDSNMNQILNSDPAADRRAELKYNAALLEKVKELEARLSRVERRLNKNSP